MKKISSQLLIIAFVFLVSCSVKYSFTGASIPPETKTVSVEYFPNKSSVVNPTLSQVFTEKMQDKFLNETSLDLIERGGDLEFSGSITRYNVSPVAASSGDLAALNRLKIEVNCTFLNKITDETWTQNFSRFEDFDATANFSNVEDELIEQIGQQLVDDIFNKALSNW